LQNQSGKNYYAPIILFCFNRPNHFEKVLNSLKNNIDINYADITIHIDGPRNKYDSKQIIKINKIIKNNYKFFNNLKIIRRKKNHGCTGSLVKTLNNHFKKNSVVIVLEDDNLLSKYFYRYMNSSLKKYEMNEKVFEISGYRFPIGDNKKNHAEYYPLSIGWGWATYKRSWEKINFDKKFIKKEIYSKFKLRIIFTMFGINNYTKILNNAINEPNKGWDICWTASILLNNAYTLIPPSSFTKNIGHDNSGINSKKTSIWDTKITKRLHKVKYPKKNKVAVFLYMKVVIFYIKRIVYRLLRV
jgi:hypothetical protein